MISPGKKILFLPIGIIAFSLISFLAVIGIFAAKPPKIENFILISLDDLRADRLGCYGNNRDVSPNIDRLAEQGARFLSAYTPYAFTPPAHIAMLASRYPSTYDGVLDPETKTLASILHSNNYRTAAFTGGAFMSTDYGALIGFKEYDDYKISLRALEKKSFSWLEANRGNKFFLLLHTYAVHAPFFAPDRYFREFADPAYSGPVQNKKESTQAFLEDANDKKIPVTAADRRRLLDIYDAQIKKVDDFIGRLVAILESLDLRKNTMIMIVSDHGEQFFEFGYSAHSTRSREFAEVSTHVPLIVSCGRLLRRKEIRPFVELIDIPPTILSAAGIPVPDTFQGVSFYPLLYKRLWFFQRKKREIYYDNIQMAGIRTRRWKLSLDFASGKLQFFDMKQDPEERNTVLVNVQGRLVRKLVGKVVAFKTENDRLNNELNTAKIALDEDPFLSSPRFDAQTALLASFDDGSYAFGKEGRKQAAIFAQGPLPFRDGKFGKGIVLLPKKNISFPPSDALKTGIKAVEFWLKITTKKKKGLRLFDFAFRGGDDSLRFQASTEYAEWIAFRLNRTLPDKGFHSLRFEFFCKFERWHHFLLSFQPNEVLLFRNGDLIARKKSLLEDFFGQDFSEWELSGEGCTLDEMRFSNVARISKAAKKKEIKLRPEVEERLKALGYIK